MPVDFEQLAATLTAERVESKREHDQLRDIIRRVRSEAEESRLAAARARLAKIELEKKIVELEADVENWKHKCEVMGESLRAAKSDKDAKQHQWDLLAVEVQKEIVGARQKYEEVMKMGLQRLVEAEDILRTRELGISDPLSLVRQHVTVTPSPPSAADPAPAPASSPCERCLRRAAKKAAASARHSAEEKQSPMKSDHSMATTEYRRTFFAERQRSPKKYPGDSVRRGGKDAATGLDNQLTRTTSGSPGSPRKGHARQRSVSSKSSRKAPLSRKSTPSRPYGTTRHSRMIDVKEERVGSDVPPPVPSKP